MYILQVTQMKKNSGYQQNSIQFQTFVPLIKRTELFGYLIICSEHENYKQTSTTCRKSKIKRAHKLQQKQ